jgi:hypothetical protein
VAERQALKNVEPFKTVLSGNQEAIAKLSMRDLEKILVATLTGMSVEEFNAEAKKWLETAKHPRWNRPYTDLAYQPMLELLRYLRHNEYKTYIVTGGVRTSCASTPSRSTVSRPSRWSGTAGGTKYGYGKDGKPFLTKEPKLRQRRRKTRRHSPDDWPPALRRLRQLDRRPTDVSGKPCAGP